jgi:hypothetical protein
MPNLENIDGLNIKSNSRINLSSGTIYATSISAATFYSGGTNLGAIFATTGSTFAQPTQVLFGSTLSGLSGSSNFIYEAPLNRIAFTPSTTPNYFGTGGITLNNGVYGSIIYTRTGDSNFGNPLGNGAYEISTTSLIGFVFGTTVNSPISIGTNNLERMRVEGTGVVRVSTLSASTFTGTTFRASSISGTTVSGYTIQSQSLTGSTDRLVQVNTGGTFTAVSDIVEAWLISGATTVALETLSNWNITGDYIGAAITDTYKGQKHYNNNYLFIAVEDNVWRRLAFV